jgi:hypothetical protein
LNEITIQKAGEKEIKIWEKILCSVPQEGDTLESRRQRIAQIIRKQARWG